MEQQNGKRKQSETSATCSSKSAVERLVSHITVAAGRELFEFTTFENWCNSAQSKFMLAGVTGKDVLCIDSQGRVCQKGLEFMRARDDGSFPVRVYLALCG